ncbi:MAG: hypothetical protein ACREJ3_03825, partial [Polyangiaceae bacterium]
MDALARRACGSALVATAVVAFAGLLAGAVRVLPWLLDPSVPWIVAEPFTRGLVAVALEASLLVGWPVGWALGSQRSVEIGEARVLQALGQSPRETVIRLLPQAGFFALALAAVAMVYGEDASAPGRVATELIEHARTSCAAVKAPATYPVPFTSMTWLCAPGREPRLAGAGPGTLSAVELTAEDARIAGDFRSLDLSDARLLLPGSSSLIAVHIGAISVRGMAPWARASTLPAPVRAVILALTGVTVSFFAAFVVLRRTAQSRLAALVLGAAGPIAALGTLQLLERLGVRPEVFAVIPLAGCTAVGLMSKVLD